MEVYVAFAICSSDWEWTDRDCTEFEARESDDGTDQDFVIGVFSSMERLRDAVAAFLPTYVVGADETLDRLGSCDPLVGVTAWKAELDGAPGTGSFVETVRTLEQLGEYPYR